MKDETTCHSERTGEESGAEVRGPIPHQYARNDGSSPPVPAAPPRSRAWSITKALIKWGLFLSVLALVAMSLGKQFRQVDWSTIRFRPLPIVGAVICLLLVPPVQLISYRTLLGAYAHTPAWGVMAAVAWIPPLGKYLPGASWVGAFYILRRFQIPVAVGLSVIIAMDGMAVISGMIVGSPIVGDFIPHYGWMIAAAFILAGVICLHPAVFARLLNFILIKTRRPPLDHVPDAKHYLLPLACAFSQWLLAGLALWLVARSVADVSPQQIPRFFSIAGLGYTIGYLVLFAPAGVGPRDLIFQKTMQRVVFPAAMSAVAVVAIRIIQTLTELTAALAGTMILRRLEREEKGLRTEDGGLRTED